MGYIFLDTETTGLDPVQHEIIEIGIVRCGPDLDVVQEWETKIRPQRIETAHPRALEINGYTPEEWESAPLFEEVAPTILSMLNGSVVCGHNVDFDIGFVDAALKRAGFDPLDLKGKVDTVQLAREHLFPKGLRSASLDNIRVFFGIPVEGGHRALKDALDALDVYKRIRAIALL